MKLAGTVIAALSVTLAYAAGDTKAGKAVYNQHCSGCHGANGVANPKIAKMMHVEIPCLGSPAVQKMSGEAVKKVKKVITEGKGKMPPVKSVTGKSVDDVIAYIRTLALKN